MSKPAGTAGPSADGADLASTDMSSEPSSRDEGTQPEFASLPVEPESEAVRRLERELEEVREQHLRLAAEFDNYRKRVSRERSELTDRAQVAVVSRLLDAMDDMDRLTGTMDNLSLEALREAVTLVDRKFWKELEAAGLEPIDPVGLPFDPSLHEAVSTAPPPSKDKDHLVAATFQVGYRFKGILVRPARVQVYSEQGQA
jgi:molecular chaperone GrpE